MAGREKENHFTKENEMKWTLEKFKELIKQLGSFEKAKVFIGDSPVVDAEGNEVEIESINLTPQAAPQDNAGNEADETDDTSGKALDADAIQKAVDAAFAKHLEKKGKLPIGGGDFRNDDTQKHGFKNMGEFGCAVAKAGNPNVRSVDERLYTKAPTGMNQAAGADGGFAVPPEFATTIWDNLHEEENSLLAMTDNYTVTGESLTMNANAETSRATGSRYGGVQGYWIAEADQIANSKPKLRQMKLEPSQLAVLVYATDKLLKNAPAMEQYLTKAAVGEIDFMVGDAIINGTGAGQPLGILNSSCVVSIAKQTGQAATTIVAENIDKMWARLHHRARANAVWFVNQDVEPQLQQLTQDVGTGGVPLFRPANGLVGEQHNMLKNRPIVPIEYAATLGTVGDIILADMSAYATGTNGTIDSAASMHLRFDYAETAFRFMFAVDGQPWLASAITPYKGSNTVSPFLTLATRS